MEDKTMDATYQPKTYRRAGGDESVVADGGKLIIESGGTIEVESGGILSIADGALAAADIALAEGNVLVGNSAGKAVALSAKTTTAILIGNGTTITSAAMTGDVTMSNAGVTAIGANKVTNSMLAAGAGVGALLTAGLGGSHSVLKTDAEVHTLLTLNAAKARACIVLVVIDETYAAVGGVAPTIKVGETDDDNLCFDVGVITNQAAGTVLAFAFTNTANKAIIITTTAATVDATGGCSVTVLAIPTT
jgi:hypothetical protein